MTRVCELVAYSLLTLGLFLGPQGIARADDNEMVVGGKVVPDGKFPWQVRIFASMDDDKGRCGGTIVAPQWVLTAAHCVVVDPTATENVKADDAVVIGYGSVDRTQTKKVESEKIIVNPDYLAKGANSHADIALIKLKDDSRCKADRARRSRAQQQAAHARRYRDGRRLGRGVGS
jgi:secreted trypsin-like serine protease